MSRTREENARDLQFEHDNRFRELVQQAIDDWPEFDTDEEVNGSDLVEWFGLWLERAKTELVK